MFVGLDVGTSSVKAALSDGASVLRSATAPLSRQSPRPGWSEQDPRAWWAASVEALRGLGDLGAARGLGLSGQMHGAVLLDAQKRPLRPAILWNDSRAAAQCDTLRARLPDIGVRAGAPPLPGFTAPKLIWMKESEPDLYARIRHVLSPKDYVGLRLHGGLATDISDAAGTLWLDQRARRWCDALCAASDTRPDWLPKLHFGAEPCGRVTRAAAAETGLPVGIAVAAGGGDAATGAMSLGVFEPGRGLLSLGTSGQILIASDAYRPNPDACLHAFAHTVPDRWYQMAAMLNGARPLAWLSGILGLSVADALAAAQRADQTRLPLFLPYLTGERSPHGDPHIRAAFYGLEDAAGRAELAMAALEGIAFSFADAADSFGPELRGAHSLYAIGNGARSDLLLQTIANATGLSMTRLADAGAGAAFGAAVLAALGAGAITPDDIRVREDGAARFTPQDAPALHDRLRRFRALYPALKSLRD